MFRKSIILCSSLLCVLFCINSAYSQFKFPKGKHIIVDGKCLENEWEKSKEFDVGKNYKIKYQKTKDFAFFCIKPAKKQMFSVELFLSPANEKLYTFHVSAKLGERVLKGEKWEDFRVDSNWWETNGWTATALRPESFTKPSFLPHNAMEFQISRKVYSGKKWRVMFSFLGGKLTYPVNANNLKTQTWAEFKF